MAATYSNKTTEKKKRERCRKTKKGKHLVRGVAYVVKVVSL